VTKPHDQIEFEEPSRSVCECCGGTTTSLTRFVTRNGAAFAIYFGRFSESHPDKYVSVLVGFGDWSEDDPSANRTAVGFRIWTDEKSYQVTFIDAAEDWETDFLGVKLTREEALNGELRQEVFDLSDHIVECDQPIVEYLNRD
jgi:hypothetical protein